MSRSGMPASPGCGRLAIGTLGVVLIAVGGLQVLVNLEAASPFGLTAFLVAVAILDDLVLIPIALGVGWIVGRVLPAQLRTPVLIALVVLAGLALIGLPFALSPARGSESGTLLTEPYLRNLGLLSAALAVGAFVAVVAGAALTRRRPSAGASSHPPST